MDTTPGFTLLENGEALEQRFTEGLRPKSLKPVPWSEAGARWGERWQASATRVAARVPDFSIASLSTLLRDAAAQERFAESVSMSSSIQAADPSRAQASSHRQQ